MGVRVSPYHPKMTPVPGTQILDISLPLLLLLLQLLLMMMMMRLLSTASSLSGHITHVSGARSPTEDDDDFAALLWGIRSPITVVRYLAIRRL